MCDNSVWRSPRAAWASGSLGLGRRSHQEPRVKAVWASARPGRAGRAVQAAPRRPPATRGPAAALHMDNAGKLQKPSGG